MSSPPSLLYPCSSPISLSSSPTSFPYSSSVSSYSWLWSSDYYCPNMNTRFPCTRNQPVLLSSSIYSFTHIQHYPHFPLLLHFLPSSRLQYCLHMKLHCHFNHYLYCPRCEPLSQSSILASFSYLHQCLFTHHFRHHLQFTHFLHYPHPHHRLRFLHPHHIRHTHGYHPNIYHRFYCIRSQPLLLSSSISSFSHIPHCPHFPLLQHSLHSPHLQHCLHIKLHCPSHHHNMYCSRSHDDDDSFQY